jgi:hypothetical protein
MRIVILLVALLAIAGGVVGVVSPDSVTALRRQYVATPIGPYAVGAVRVAIGLLLIRFAPASRTPKTLRALGAVVCIQGLVQGVAFSFVGLERARAILEWEAAHPALLRVGALIALAFGGFVAFAVTNPPPRSSN